MTILTTHLSKLEEEYIIDNKQYDSQDCSVYHGKDRNGVPVLIHVFNVDRPRNIDIVRLKQESERIRELPSSGIIQLYDVVHYNNRPAVVLERFGEKTLRDILTFNEYNLELFLKISLQLTGTLEELHAANIVHKNLRPDNILFYGDTVKISDFGIFSLFKKYNENLHSDETINTFLPYISPEQTNKMNRSIDSRSDMYSLGIILYEMFTGVCPSASDNPIDIIHFHIAREPEPPVNINSEIPAVISEIIMKLLKKTAEERYQSAYGLHADIKRCYDNLKEKGRIDTFTIGSDDLSSRFTIPHMIVGRERELSLLLESFNSILSSDNDKHLVLVTGPPGIGKSSLVMEMQKTVVEKNGIFLKGKHVKMQNNLPYYSIIQAFQGFVSHIMKESEESISEWKDVIINATGDYGKIITDMIPEMELIIGEQDELIDIQNTDAAFSRFNNALISFIKVISSRNSLFLFLDDLQWADNGTINLIRHIILDEKIKNFMIVISYRDTDHHETKHLNNLLQDLEKAYNNITRIPMSPLTVSKTTRYISTILHKKTESIGALGKLIHRKTGGNPFFINQFMKSIYDNNSITYYPGEGWQYNLDEIINFDITENVVDLLTEKIKKLTSNIQEILTISSCIGSTFSLDLVSELIHNPLELMIIDTSFLLGEEFIVQVNGKYRFAHDRIMEAAYSLIDKERRESIHYRIGKIALDRHSDDDLDEHIDFIVNQLNAGRNNIDDENEKNRLIELNIMAADKAKKSVAFESAFDYLISALNLINIESWVKNYLLVLKLYTRTAEAAFHLADFSIMRYLCNVIIRNGRSILDKIPAYELIIESLYAENKLEDALRQGRLLLKELGYTLPRRPGKINLLLSILKTRIKLSGIDIDDIKKIDNIQDARILAVIRSLSILGVASYKTVPRLLPLLMFKTIELSLKHGNAPETAYAFAAYGMILCGVLGKIDSGYMFGELAHHLSERPEGIKYTAKTRHLIECMIRHWKEHIRETLEPIYDAYRLGLENGDVENATSSIHLHCVYSYFAGNPLPGLINNMREYQEEIQRYKQETNLNYFNITYQALLNINGYTENPVFLTGTVYDETSNVPIHEKANDKTALCIYSINKMILHYLFGFYRKAVEYGEHAKEYQDSLVGLFFIPVLYFYDSLSLIMSCNNAPKKIKKNLLRELRKNQKKLNYWAENSPQNYKHKSDLVEAERLRLFGKTDGAIRMYDKAIRGAKENRFMQEEALSHELAAQIYIDIEDIDTAAEHILKAHDIYREWGAHAKVKQLEKEYPHFFYSQIEHHIDTIEEERIQEQLPYPAIEKEALDLYTIVNALQAISSEIILEKLIEKIMNIIVEHAGAQKGVLFLRRNGEIYTEAECLAEPRKFLLHSSILSSDFDAVPQTVVNYVKRTGEYIVLGNATENGLFADDPYIRENDSRSLLCFPLIARQDMKGIIYLENRIAAHVFNPKRFEVTRLLATQAAFSLENAILFDRTVRAEEELQEQYELMQSQYEEMEALNQNLEEVHKQLMDANEDLAIFKRFAESSGQGFTMSDLNGTIKYANTSFCSMIHAESVEEVNGIGINACYPDEFESMLNHLILPEVNKNQQWTGEIPLKTLDGETVETIQNIFFIKDRTGEPLYYAHIMTDISRLKETERMLTESEKRYRTLVETMNDGIVVLNEHSEITYANRTFCSMLGYDADVILGKSILDYLDDVNREHIKKQMILRRNGITEQYELEFSRKDGKTVSTLISPQIITDSEGKYNGSFGVVNDVTEKKNLERQLLQAQKMEAIGNLAGGIAHDFNNFLTAITGYSSLIISQIDGESDIAESAREILKAAERSASLTRQLLAFSRKQLLRSEMLNINNVITDMENLLRRVIGEDIEMSTELFKKLEPVHVDRGQVEQTLMNIVVNARDAMPNGGQLIIKTNNIQLDQAMADDLPGAIPGRYVKIDIIDSGDGIQSDIIGKIFEPFFTTKDIGEGTGLGLSVVYGIVKQHGGNIYVTSNPPIGTTFTILFPVSEKTSSGRSTVKKAEKTARTGNNEKILLVEDQVEVSRFAEIALERNGYRVFSSSTLSEALNLYEKMNGDFDCIFSDVVLPDGTGPQLVEKIKQTGNDIKIILTSGYSDRKSQAETIAEKGYYFLQKPYSLEDLLDMLSRVLRNESGE